MTEISLQNPWIWQPHRQITHGTIGDVPAWVSLPHGVTIDNKEAPKIVLLSGHGYGAAPMDLVAEEAARMGYVAITPDYANLRLCENPLQCNVERVLRVISALPPGALEIAGLSRGTTVGLGAAEKTDRQIVRITAVAPGNFIKGAKNMSPLAIANAVQKEKDHEASARLAQPDRWLMVAYDGICHYLSRPHVVEAESKIIMQEPTSYSTLRRLRKEKGIPVALAFGDQDPIVPEADLLESIDSERRATGEDPFDFYYRYSGSHGAIAYYRKVARQVLTIGRTNQGEYAQAA